MTSKFTKVKALLTGNGGAINIICQVVRYASQVVYDAHAAHSLLYGRDDIALNADAYESLFKDLSVASSFAEVVAACARFEPLRDCAVVFAPDEMPHCWDDFKSFALPSSDLKLTNIPKATEYGNLLASILFRDCQRDAVQDFGLLSSLCGCKNTEDLYEVFFKRDEKFRTLERRFPQEPAEKRVELAVAFENELHDDRNYVARASQRLVLAAKQWLLNEIYAPYVAILQSSGSGKSRLVKELGKSHYSLQICLRPLAASGYPPRTPSLAEYLLSSTNNGEKTFTAFLVAFFQHLKAVFESNNAASGSAKVLPAAFLEQQYPKVVAQPDPSASGGTAKALESDKSTRFWNQFYLERVQTVSLERTSLEKAFMEASDAVPDGSHQTVFISIDEASELLKNRDGKVESLRNSFRDFRRALRKVPKPTEKLSFVAIFLDTASRIANFTPSKDRDPSLRDAGESDKLLKPWWILPWWDLELMHDKMAFDQAELDVFECIEKAKPEEALKFLHHQFKKGRPLWPSSYLAQADQESINYALLVAQTKLAGGFPALPKTLSEEAFLSVLDCRIRVFPSPHSNQAESLVANHLACCRFISDDRAQLVVSHLSEPIVAAAASILLRKYGWTTAIKQLTTFIQADLVEGGRRGELIARVLLSMAWDHASRQSVPSSLLIGAGAYPINVRRFVDSLFGFDAVMSTLGEDDRPERRLRLEQIMNGFIYITHFVQVTYTPNRDDLIKFYRRGAAILCKPYQTAFDIILPIKLADGQMSMIAIDVKNYSGRVSGDDAASHCSATRAGINDGASVPYLVVFMSVGNASLDDLIISPPVSEPVTKRARTATASTVAGFETNVCAQGEERTAFLQSKEVIANLSFRAKKTRSGSESNEVKNQFVLGAFGLGEILYKFIKDGRTPDDAAELFRLLRELRVARREVTTAMTEEDKNDYLRVAQLEYKDGLSFA